MEIGVFWYALLPSSRYYLYKTYQRLRHIMSRQHYGCKIVCVRRDSGVAILLLIWQVTTYVTVTWWFSHRDVLDLVWKRHFGTGCVFQTCSMSWAWEVAGQCLRLRRLPEGDALHLRPLFLPIHTLHPLSQSVYSTKCAAILLRTVGPKYGQWRKGTRSLCELSLDGGKSFFTTSDNKRLSALIHNCFCNRDISFEEEKV